MESRTTLALPPIVHVLLSLLGCTPTHSTPPQQRPHLLLKGENQERYNLALTLLKEGAHRKAKRQIKQLCSQGEVTYCLRAVAALDKMGVQGGSEALLAGCRIPNPVLCAHLGERLSQAKPRPLLTFLATPPRTQKELLAHALLHLGVGKKRGVASPLLVRACRGGAATACLLWFRERLTRLTTPEIRQFIRLKGTILPLLPAELQERVSLHFTKLNDLLTGKEREKPKTLLELGLRLLAHNHGLSPGLPYHPYREQERASVERLIASRLGLFPSALATPPLPEYPSLSLFQRACDQGAIKGCYMGALVSLLMGNSPQRFLRKYAATNATRCAKGELSACFAHLLQITPTLEAQKETPLHPLRPLSQKLLKQMRAEDVTAYNTLAKWPNQFHFTRKRQRSLRRHLKAGCELGSAQSCLLYGQLLERVGTVQKSRSGRNASRKSRRRLRLAAWAYKRACERGRFRACYPLSLLYLNGFGVKKSIAQQRHYLERTRSGLKGECAKGRGHACYALANLEGLAKGRTHLLLKRGCAYGDERACTKLYQITLGATALRLGVALSRLHCSLGQHHACVLHGALLLTMVRKPTRGSQAQRWFDRACQLNLASACWIASYNRRISALTPPQLTQAYRTLKSVCKRRASYPCSTLYQLRARRSTLKRSARECESGSWKGCARLGKALLIPSMKPLKEGFEEVWLEIFPHLDPPLLSLVQPLSVRARAYHHLLSACRSGGMVEACIGALDLASSKDMGIPQSRQEPLMRRVNTALSTRCQGGDPRACTTMAHFCLQQKMGCNDQRRAEALFARGFSLLKARCSKKNPIACYEAAKLLDQSDPEAKRFSEVLSYMEHACKGRVAKACSFIGMYWFTRSTTDRGGRYLGRACRLKEFRACYSAGRFYERRGGKRELKLAKRYYSKACQARVRRACFALQQLR